MAIPRATDRDAGIHPPLVTMLRIQVVFTERAALAVPDAELVEVRCKGDRRSRGQTGIGSVPDAGQEFLVLAAETITPSGKGEKGLRFSCASPLVYAQRTERRLGPTYVTGYRHHGHRL